MQVRAAAQRQSLIHPPDDQSRLGSHLVFHRLTDQRLRGESDTQITRTQRPSRVTRPPSPHEEDVIITKNR
ncbi:hypothetical protein DPEC_G00110210 [Dallia pectoralis]|uniref:Uncharacterized protein n=1 Tax=Dallia pectoralis TaxID=75939 RepID=A0ACC2GT39_DALPE|nr:hypothetical protein DPEC_G00110210 [Dallia pectoralis]